MRYNLNPIHAWVILSNLSNPSNWIKISYFEKLKSLYLSMLGGSAVKKEGIEGDIVKKYQIYK